MPPPLYLLCLKAGFFGPRAGEKEGVLTVFLGGGLAVEPDGPSKLMAPPTHICLPKLESSSHVDSPLELFWNFLPHSHAHGP